MSQAYFTEDQKLYRPNRVAWTDDECYLIREILYGKGYPINCVSRLGCDRKPHDAWEVLRADVPYLIEQLFRQRITVEVQAEGHGKAGIIFVYDYSSAQIIDAVGMFQRNKRGT